MRSPRWVGFFVSGQLSGVLEDRRTQRMIDSYSDHFIIRGFGRVGRQVARDLRAADYRMEEIEVLPGCAGAEKTIAPVRGSSVIVAVRRSDGTVEAQPGPRRMIEPGDRLVALGAPGALGTLEGQLQPASVANR